MINNLIIGFKRLDLQDSHKYLISYPDDNSCSIAKEGVIALQYHSPGGFEVRFRNIRIKLLGDN